MVDWISLIIAILGVIIAIVAIVLVFVIKPSSGGGSTGTGPVGPIGPTGPTGTSGGGGGGGAPLAYGAFSSKSLVPVTVTSNVQKSFPIVLTADGAPKNITVDVDGIIKINTGVRTLLTITGSNAILPDRATITDINLITILTVTNGTSIGGLTNTNTYNIFNNDYNTLLSSAFSWSGVVESGCSVQLATSIQAFCPNGTGTVNVALPPTYINIVTFIP